MENIMKINRTQAGLRFTNRAAGQASYFASGVFPTNFDSNNGLYFLMQLQENAGVRGNYSSGWEFYQRLLTRMQVLQGTAAVADDTSKCNTWVLEASKASGKNMVAFHKAWKFPVTPETEAAVAALGLPPFEFDATAPCGEECVQCCLPGELSPTISGKGRSRTISGQGQLEKALHSQDIDTKAIDKSVCCRTSFCAVVLLQCSAIINYIDI
jgi:hypothetical protein